MSAKLITSIYVEKLFGLYTYRLPDSGELSNAAILYGDNGVGKSTLLRLAFHLLSAANDRGHRTALIQTDFECLKVELSSGVTLTAKIRQEQDLRVLTLEIIKADRPQAIWDYHPRKESSTYRANEELFIEVGPDGRRRFTTKNRVGQKAAPDAVPRGNDAYLPLLAQCAPKMFILNAERRLDSDTVADPSDEMELRRVMHYDEPKRINELVARSREIALSQALGAAANWIGRKAILGTNQGSTNVHSAYVDVLHHLLTRTASQSDISGDRLIPQLIKKLADIESSMAQHAKYELATRLSTGDFRKALSAKAKAKRNLAAELLQPYIRSLERRLEAVEPIYRLIDRFVNTLNGFLSDKTIDFKLSQGFSIQNRLGSPLRAAQLSSGEQQLLLLFCYVLTARDHPSVFMIDEPEISLNIKWQRQLIQSLLEITDGATIQFVFASHSIEILTRHKTRVVRLVNKS